MAPTYEPSAEDATESLEELRARLGELEREVEAVSVTIELAVVNARRREAEGISPARRDLRKLVVAFERGQRDLAGQVDEFGSMLDSQRPVGGWRSVDEDTRSTDERLAQIRALRVEVMGLQRAIAEIRRRRELARGRRRRLKRTAAAPVSLLAALFRFLASPIRRARSRRERNRDAPPSP